MDKQKENLREASDLSAKPQWQQTKEEWYDHLNITVKQLDMIIWGACIALAGVFVLIALDAMNII